MKRSSHTFRNRILAIGLGLTTTILASCGGDAPKEPTAEAPPQASASYSLDQQVFCLNILSNISAHFNGATGIQDSTIAAVTRTLSNATVQGYIGNWQLVWGPYVLTNSAGDTAINTMFVVQRPNTDTFVVAIAGTDPASKFDWYFEDADVVPWPWAFNSGAGYITAATKTGLDILGNMGDKTAAQTVLAENAKAMDSIHVWVTGHSLGGALSPAFGLFLHDNMPDWAPKKNVDIHVLAVAGATPGDAKFAAYYNNALGATTRRVWNTRDVVPHGYAEYMLHELDTLYPADSIKPIPEELKILVWAVEKASAAQNYTQLTPATNDSFMSFLYTADSIKNKSSKFSETNYADQAIFQHIPAYGVYFNTLGFQQAVQQANNMPYPFFTQGAILVGTYPQAQ